VRFWWGVVAAAIALSPAVTPHPGYTTETFVQTVQADPTPWQLEPPSADEQQHAQCMVDLLNHLGLEVTVQNLFVTGDYADLVYGGPCEMMQ